MTSVRLYDVFITHAWRYHDDWTQAADALDAVPGLKWRNFSVPWHDPAMTPHTEVGGRFIREWLESQIIPVHVVFFLAGVYAVKSNQKWLELELEMARAHHKPVIGLPAIGAAEVPAELKSMCNRTVTWRGDAIFEAIEALTRRTQAT